jgi:hypothetical protein
MRRERFSRFKGFPVSAGKIGPTASFPKRYLWASSAPANCFTTGIAALPRAVFGWVAIPFQIDAQLFA